VQQAAAIFTIDDDAGEGKHEQSRHGLKYDESAQAHLGMRRLQNEPCHRGGIHAAADHRYQIRDEDQPESTMFEQ
jgi:hypothetical protein